MATGGIEVGILETSGSDGSTDNAASGNAEFDGLIIVDPGSIGDGGSGGNDDGGSTGEPAKRRGRKPGTRSARAPKGQALDINGVEAVLFSMHNILAAVTKVPELALDKAESTELAKGISNVARHYDVSASAKSIDIANLAMIAATVYGTRLFAFRARRDKERKARAASDAAEKTFFNPFTGATERVKE